MAEKRLVAPANAWMCAAVSQQPVLVGRLWGARRASGAGAEPRLESRGPAGRRGDQSENATLAQWMDTALSTPQAALRTATDGGDGHGYSCTQHHFSSS